MSSVAATIESDKAAALKKDLQAIIDRIEDTQRLLALADPDQYFKPGSKIADAAVQRAKRALELEKQRRRAEEAQQKQAQASCSPVTLQSERHL